MQAVEVLGNYISRGVYTVSGPFHPFGGAVDIIVVQQQDGSFRSSPWYVRFGKFQGVLTTKKKVVNIFVNGTEAGFRMCLDNKGEAYFLRECDSNEGECVFSSPSTGDEADGGVRDELHRKIQSCDYKSGQMESVSRFDVENGKLVERTNSGQSTIFGLVFGRKMKKEAGLGNIPRIDSLERAEIAADLLETKWSTNLPANVRRSRNSPRSPLNKDDKDVSVVGEESNKSACDEALGSIVDGINDKSASGIVKLETPDDIAGQTLPCLTTTHQEVVEIHRSGTGGDVAGEVETIPKVESDKSDAALADSVNNNPVAGFLSSNFAVLSNGLEHVLHEKDNNLVSTDSINQGGGREVSTYVYRETFESSTITFDNAAEKSVGLSLDRNKQAKFKGKVVHENSKLNTEINSRLENGAFIDTGSYSENESFLQEHLENPSCTSDSQTEFSRGTFDSATANCDSTEHLIPCPENLGFESASSPDVHIQGSKSILEATQQDMMKEGCLWNEMGNTAQVGSFENQLKREGTESTSDSQTTSEGVQPLNSSVVELHSISDFPNIDELKDQAREAPKVTLGAKAAVLSFLDETSAAEYPGIRSGSDEVAHASITLPNAIKDDQFLLYNNDNCTSDELHSEYFTSNEVQLDVDPLLVENIDAEEHLSNDTTAKMPSDILSSETSAHSNPICIPGSVTNSKAAGWLSRSLPNSLSHTHDWENSDAFDALGQSLPLNSRISEPGVRVEGFSSSQGFDAGSINKMVQVETTEMTAANVILESSTTQAGRTCNPNVELSLCKHLLFEGMGAKAASQVFDSEKIDLGMYAVLGPSVVKNNKLIVRIGSRYFPWDAAAPIILGMVSFGQDQIFDSKGMIAVDKDESARKGDHSKAIVSSRGTWNLWPFSLRKPRTRSTDNLALNEQKGKESDVVLEDSLSGVTNMSKRRIMKKHVKSLSPSSEQLASLCLKEGQNLVTFNFETAMLGKQQVDARIYLWKWNTRIVVSDVDGTITKSDVLGQFMPLVGKDWSQTGVAHFFSSIKDNGYQFLYLSARAISQASLTRQFLFNLKQDGKALPDGPVVISPDGLFPSLYREVIRRAPHEFKISCLEGIKAVFPPDCNPFYAGFGNRHTDEISYLKAGIPKGKIFTINPKGEVVVNNHLDTKSYHSLHALVNGMFPATLSVEQEDFNTWNFWRTPLPDIPG